MSVVVLAHTGFVIRNLLLGDFARLCSAEVPLEVAVQNPDDARLAALLPGERVELIAFPPPAPPPVTSRERLRSPQFYMHFFKEVEKDTASIRLQTRVHRMQYSRKGHAFIAGTRAVGRLIAGLGLMPVAEALYLRAVARSPEVARWRELLSQRRPRYVLSTLLTLATNELPSVDLPAVIAAHELGIPCGTLVQSWDNLSTKGAVLPPWLANYWTWSEAQSAELRAFYPRIPPERISWVGAPQFDFHPRPEIRVPRASYAAEHGLDPAKLWVVYCTGTPKALPDEPAAVLAYVRALAAAAPRAQVLIRLHPKDDGSRWATHRSELATLDARIAKTAPDRHMDSGGFEPPADFYGQQVNALVHAAVVVNASSTITIDASIVDRPVICVAYDAAPDPKFPEGRARSFAESTHYQKLVATGAMKLAYSLEECVAATRAYLAGDDRERAGRQKLISIVTQQADGRAGERLAAEVIAAVAAAAG